MTGLLFTFQFSHSNIPAFLINKQASKQFSLSSLKHRCYQDLLGDFQACFVLPVFPSSFPNFKSFLFISLFGGLVLVLLFILLVRLGFWCFFLFGWFFYTLSIDYAVMGYVYVSLPHLFREIKENLYIYFFYPQTNRYSLFLICLISHQLNSGDASLCYPPIILAYHNSSVNTEGHVSSFQNPLESALVSFNYNYIVTDNTANTSYWVQLSFFNQVPHADVVKETQ